MPGAEQKAISVASPRALATFLSVTFVSSWSCWIAAGVLGGGIGDVLAISGRFGPLLGAVVATVAVDRRSFRDFVLERLGSLAPWWLWPLALLSPALVVLTALAVAAASGDTLGEFNDLATLYLIVPAFVGVLALGGPLGEEAGWRGLALDPMQARLGPLWASVLLGLVWGLWHLPLFLDATQVQHGLPLAVYLGQTTATSFVYTWVWNRSTSLPLVIALHTSTNLSAGVFPLLVPEAASQRPFVVAVLLSAVAALALVLGTRGSLGYSARTVRG